MSSTDLTIVGLLHLKTMQDAKLPLEDCYIQLAIELPHESNSEDDLEDNEEPLAPFRVVICMFPGNSRRLQQAQYLQSDIGFKRIQGFREFELSGKDIQSNISQFSHCFWNLK